MVRGGFDAAFDHDPGSPEARHAGAGRARRAGEPDRSAPASRRPTAGGGDLARVRYERTYAARRLAEEATSVSALVDLALRSRARELVESTSLPVSASAFTHAFRRWSGAAPRTVRARAHPRSGNRTSNISMRGAPTIS
jgi:hypothetical protein